MTVRPNCIICGKENTEHLYNFGKFPILMACTDQPPAQDVTLDMNWEICRDCGNIQLKNLVPLEILYLANHNDAVGKTWSDHNEAFSAFITKYEPSNVMEIGGGSGKIAKLTLQSPTLNSWTLLEPNPILNFADPKLKVIKSWMKDLEKTMCSNIDTVVHSHVMEHFYSPNEEVARGAEIFPAGHRAIFSIPNLKEWLRAKFFNALMFEHSYLLEDDSLRFIMNKNGYKFVGSQPFRDHSTFYCFESTGQRQPATLPQRYLENKNLFDAYIAYCKSEGEGIAKKLKDLQDETQVYIFGAHIFAQILLHFGVPEKSIECILDNSKAKIGRRLYGHSLTVRAPESIQGMSRPTVILRAGAYNDEIKKQLQAINPLVHII